jgi:hypothetical protein
MEKTLEIQLAELREEIAKEIEAYAKTQEKTMQKAAYECVAIAKARIAYVQS